MKKPLIVILEIAVCRLEKSARIGHLSNNLSYIFDGGDPFDSEIFSHLKLVLWQRKGASQFGFVPTNFQWFDGPIIIVNTRVSNSTQQ